MVAILRPYSSPSDSYTLALSLKDQKMARLLVGWTLDCNLIQDLLSACKATSSCSPTHQCLCDKCIAPLSAATPDDWTLAVCADPSGPVAIITYSDETSLSLDKARDLFEKPEIIARVYKFAETLGATTKNIQIMALPHFSK